MEDEKITFDRFIEFTMQRFPLKDIEQPTKAQHIRAAMNILKRADIGEITLNHVLDEDTQLGLLQSGLDIDVTIIRGDDLKDNLSKTIIKMK